MKLLEVLRISSTILLDSNTLAFDGNFTTMRGEAIYNMEGADRSIKISKTSD